MRCVPSSDPASRFRDIVDNIDRIRHFTLGYDADSFVRDERTVYAVKHALLIISEAARKLDAVAEQLAPDIPWADIRGLGNRLRHEYETVELTRIWFIVERDLDPLLLACRKAMDRLKGKPD